MKVDGGNDDHFRETQNIRCVVVYVRMERTCCSLLGRMGRANRACQVPSSTYLTTLSRPRAQRLSF